MLHKDTGMLEGIMYRKLEGIVYFPYFKLLKLREVEVNEWGGKVWFNLAQHRDW
jgi:hypothetical protein